MKHIYKQFTGILMVMMVIFTACQKDQTAVNPLLKADTVKALDIRERGNYLATKGSLTITIHDSTYTFDAAQDSIAFVNVSISGQQYYGITAINKAHTLSFGISSYGTAESGLSGTVAGSQFLSMNSLKSNQQFTLSKNILPKDIGSIALERYKQDSTLAKGTFKTYLSKDGKSISPFYKSEGSFNLLGVSR
jgi:hypothetical protein